MRVIAGSLKGPSPEGADVGRAAADVRQAARDAVQRPGAARSRARGCSTATPARARSASRRSAAARAHVTFVEQRSRARRRSSPRTSRTAAIDERLCYHPRDVAARARDAREPAIAPFDIVLLDPPYDDDGRRRVRSRRRRRVLAPDGVVVLEHARRRAAPDAPGRLVRVARTSIRRQRADASRRQSTLTI